MSSVVRLYRLQTGELLIAKESSNVSNGILVRKPLMIIPIQNEKTIQLTLQPWSFAGLVQNGMNEILLPHSLLMGSWSAESELANGYIKATTGIVQANESSMPGNSLEDVLVTADEMTGNDKSGLRLVTE